ncbi:MAG: MFS transporter [Deltaproteobacteria bacterium]|nr:MFS transporter [Deltaproteobacteria bacterium]
MQPSDIFQHQKRNVLVLALCQAIMMTSNTVMWSTGPLVGVELAPAVWLATIPNGLTVLFNAFTSMPASNLMQRLGRRRGFMTGAAIGTLGAALIAGAIFWRSFAVLMLGNATVGTYLAFAQKYRFAAVDAAKPLFKSKAMSLVLAGGVVAPFAGSALANLTRATFDPIMYSGCYAATAVCTALTIPLLGGLRIPAAGSEEGKAGGRPLGVIVRQEAYVVAAVGGAVSWLVLQVPMIGGSLAMKKLGFPFKDISFIVMWRMFAMFAPSFVTGALLQRFGILRMMVVGAGLLTAALVVLLMGASIAVLWVGMILIGVGWSILFLASSRLLVETHTAAERGRAQGFFDSVAFGVSAAAVLTTAGMFEALGFELLNGVLLVPCVLCLVLTARLAARRRKGSAPLRS